MTALITDAMVDEALSAYENTDDSKHACMRAAIEAAMATSDARLMAAAPDLVKALKMLLKEVVVSGNADAVDFGWAKALAATREAIAKTGWVSQ
jgi:hypothetical protein